MAQVVVRSYLLDKFVNFSLSNVIETRHERAWTSGALILSSAAVSYFVHKYIPDDLPSFVRVSVGGVVAAPLLMFPKGLAKGSQQTLMVSSLCGMMAGRVISGIGEKKEKELKVEESENVNEDLRIKGVTNRQQKGFFSWIGDFFWYLYPVINVEQEKDRNNCTWTCVVKEALFDIACGVVKSFVLFPLTVRYLAYQTSVSKEVAATAGNGVLGMLRQYVQSCQQNFAFGLVIVLTGMAINDYVGAGVKLATKGKYEHLPFNDCVPYSRTLRELWGRRYNRWVNYWMREVCYDPMRRSGHPAWLSSLCCFGVSGLLHVYVSHFAFSKCPITALRAFSFFMLHGCLCYIEKPILNNTTDYITRKIVNYTDNQDPKNIINTRRKVANVVGGGWVVGACFFTLPLYTGLFKFPAWAIQNPFPVNKAADKAWDYLLPSVSYKFD